MDNKDLSFLVVGAGAIGGITAALLKKKGYDVEIVCKYDEYASLISLYGIEVDGVCGKFKIAMPAYTTINEVKTKKDVVLHATKTNDITESAHLIKNILKDDGLVVSLQNGICEDKLAEILGRNRVVGCVTGWGATMKSPGYLTMTSTGDFILGYLCSEPDSRLIKIAESLSSIVPARTTNNIMGHLYSKLIINSCISSLGAICGLFLGEMLFKIKIRRIFIEIIHESVDVANSMHLKLEVFGGRLDYYKFVNGKSLFADVRRHIMLLIIGYKYRRLKSSSLQSLERGKPTEVDFFNGYIVKNGFDLNVPVTVNALIINIIHDIEQNKRTISLSNFSDHEFDRFN